MSSPTPAATMNQTPLVRDPLMGNLLRGKLSKPLPAAVSDATHPPVTVSFDNNSMEDLWMAITWGTA